MLSVEMKKLEEYESVMDISTDEYERGGNPAVLRAHGLLEGEIASVRKLTEHARLLWEAFNETGKKRNDAAKKMEEFAKGVLPQRYYAKFAEKKETERGFVSSSMMRNAVEEATKATAVLYAVGNGLLSAVAAKEALDESRFEAARPEIRSLSPKFSFQNFGYGVSDAEREKKIEKMVGYAKTLETPRPDARFADESVVEWYKNSVAKQKGIQSELKSFFRDGPDK